MKRLLVIALLVAACFRGQAQDFHLSMYDAAPMFLNPAMTGVFEGEWRVHGQYRTQWKAVNYKPYTTALISFDASHKKWGFGGQITNYRAGIGNYNALQGLASIGYTVSIDQKKTHNISFGVQGGVTQKSIEYQLHTFNNQYSSSNGGTFNGALPSGESFTGQTLLVPDVNAGFLYFNARQRAKFNPFFGFSAFNLLQPSETLFGGTNTLPMRFYGHAGLRINLMETFYVLPKVLAMQQGNFYEVTVAADVGLYFKSAELYLTSGLIYRNKDAIVVSLGAKKSNYIAKIAYDFNSSQLTEFSAGRGGFEISFTYMFQQGKSEVTKICPRL